MKTTMRFVAALAACASFTASAQAATRCTKDMVKVGSFCVDTYEATVWRVPDPLVTNKGLVRKIQKGKADLQDLIDGGATQLGTTSDNYTPCTDNGQNCVNDTYAVSLAGERPSAYITWFQAQVACSNAGKRLPSNSEWQQAVAGSPDPGADNGTTDCNSTYQNGTVDPTLAGARTSCLSSYGAFDMVANLNEWVADWAPLSTDCPGWGAISNDYQCFAGADTVATGGPAALLRGGNYIYTNSAGPLTVIGLSQPSDSGSQIGFRCAR